MMVTECVTVGRCLILLEKRLQRQSPYTSSMTFRVLAKSDRIYNVKILRLLKKRSSLISKTQNKVLKMI